MQLWQLVKPEDSQTKRVLEQHSGVILLKQISSVSTSTSASPTPADLEASASTRSAASPASVQLEDLETPMDQPDAQLLGCRLEVRLYKLPIVSKQ